MLSEHNIGLQVSAEVATLSVTLSHTLKVVEKSDAAKARIRAVIQHSFLLRGLLKSHKRPQSVISLCNEQHHDLHQVVSTSINHGSCRDAVARQHDAARNIDAGLEEEQEHGIVDAMFEKAVAAEEVVIRCTSHVRVAVCRPH